MALTFQQIWESKSVVSFKRDIQLKRLQQNGAYEAGFTSVSERLIQDSAVNSFRQNLPNNSYDFGKVIVSNASLKMASPFREFSSEKFPDSLFSGFIRDKSQIRIVDTLVDDITDPENPVDVSVIIFTGLIDGVTAKAEEFVENFTARDFISILETINIQALTLSQTTLSDLVFEIMNRSEFTKFFTVDALEINPGYDALNIDISVYENTVLDTLEDLARGHSIFLIDPKDNTFKFKPADPTPTVQFEFLESNPRISKIKKFSEGVDRQITHWYWEDTAIKSVKFPEPINQRPGTFNIIGVTDNVERQNLLDVVRLKTEDTKQRFDVEIPYFPIINLLDRVKIQQFGEENSDDAWRWDFSQWSPTPPALPATRGGRWVRPAGIIISKSGDYLVRGIRHTNSFRTVLEVERILS